MAVEDEGLTARIRAAMPLCAALDIEALVDGPDEVRLVMPWAPERCTTGGVLHGGALMALADAAGGALAFRNLPEGSTGTATIESRTSLLGAVRGGTVTAIARPLKVGHRVIVVETELVDDDGRLVAKTTQSQIVS